MTQVYTPSDQELNSLAKAKINPVLWDVFSGGGGYVFKDELTCAPVESSIKKQISVADMSSSIDISVARYGKDVLQLPMQVALKRLNDFLTVYFEAAHASGWLVPAEEPAMEGMAWKFEVVPMQRIRSSG